MSRRILYFLAAALFLASCTREIVPAPQGQNLVFDFTVDAPISKGATKTSWISGDKIVLFFNNDASKGYLTLTYDGSKWAATPSSGIEAAISSAGESGKFDAAFCADSDGSVKNTATGQWMVGGEDSFFLSQSDGSYTLSEGKVSFNVKVSLEYGTFVQMFIPGAAEGDLLHVHGATRENYDYTTGLKASSSAVYYSGSKADFYALPHNINDNIKGHAREDGAAFYALNYGENDENFTFCLHHEGKDYYYKVSGKAFDGKMSIKLPALSAWTEDEARCVLYKDGHLVLNQFKSEDDAFSSYGEIDETFDVPTGESTWSASKSKIIYVEVASPFKPATMQKWFYYAQGLKEFHGKGIDASAITSLNMAFFFCKNMTVCDFSSWCQMASLTNTTYAFHTCSALKTIYTSATQDWSAITPSQNIFYNCTKLVGGNGTTFSTEHKDNSYARVDKVGQPGYFTAVDSPATEDSFSAGDAPAWWNPSYRETTTPTDADSALVAKVLSSVKVNMCVYSDEQRQWVGYYDGEHRMCVAQRTLPTGPWKYVTLDEQNAWDSHNYITMHKDSKGVLRVSGNMHATPLVFFQTDESGEISTLHRVKNLTGQYEDQVTYPKFMDLKDGRVLYHFRTGISGNGDEIYDVLNEDASWSLFLDTPLTDGEGQRNAYMLDPLMDGEGNYHLVWVWRESYKCETNHDLSHAWSPDMKNWYAADGTALTLPIKYVPDDKIIVDNSPVNGGMFNGGQALGFDSENRPVISYYKYDENDHSQFYIARFQDGQWKKTKLTDLDYKWEFSGGGSIVKKMSVGEPVQETTGEITVVCTVNDNDLPYKYSKEIWVDGQTLEFIKEASVRSAPARFPSWVNTLQTSGYSGTLVINKSYDINDGLYMARWESLKNNNDVKPTCELPPPTELRIVKLNY